MSYHYNIRGVIKLLKPTGFGFILPDEQIGIGDKDVFFHAESLVDKDVDWRMLKVGQKVLIGTIIVNRKGLQAEEVTLLRANSRSRSARKDLTHQAQIDA